MEVPKDHGLLLPDHALLLVELCPRKLFRNRYNAGAIEHAEEKETITTC